MQIKVSGKNLDIGNSLREFTIKEIENLIDKYVGESINSTVTIAKDNRLFYVEVRLYLAKGFILKTNGSSDDPYKAVSISLERLEERIKRHKNRIKNKQKRATWEVGALNATKYIIERKDSNNDLDEEHLIIVDKESFILTFSVSEAVMKLDLGDLPVVVFKNGDTNRINIVYKRPDGHIGWIDYKE
ncbi:MAG: ribosome-associated translation inhibitor RaiA [Holosporales bacterium]|jgi:ribosomal subunit interface protein|nr:ribosome-associated translation inhibitor RaiA [Holosporales bacterium]